MIKISILWHPVNEQLAVHITDEEEERMLSDLALLDAVDFNAAPFDEWRMDENRELEELLRLPDDLFTDAEKEKEDHHREEGVSEWVTSDIPTFRSDDYAVNAWRFGIELRKSNSFVFFKFH